MWEAETWEGMGSGTGESIIVDGMEVELSMANYDVEVEEDKVYVELDPAEFDIELTLNEFEVEICDA